MVIDNNSYVRFAIRKLLEEQPDMSVAGEAPDPVQALPLIRRLQPNAVILDLALPGRSGLDLLKDIHAEFPDLPVLVLTMLDEEIYAEVALHAGASGFLHKNMPAESAVQALREILNGAIYASSALATRLLQAHLRGGREPGGSPFEQLSDRELEVLQLIGQWRATREIAATLRISIKTVEYYREQIKKKLNLKTGNDLVRYATRRFSADANVHIPD